uniref:Uncharacterized protein n=1 Tax=Prevotella sp. GTC17262 TaxID=3236797 RepID=A0AB33JLC8_9BACT
MITTLFLIIAFFRRRRFLSKDTPTGAKVIYYFLNVALTPIFGPWLFKMLNEATWVTTPRKGAEEACIPPDIIDSII